jgi:hypothetical protein
MKKIISFSLQTIILSLILTSCKDNSVNSVDNTPPGRRDYVWTLDTLVTQNNSIHCIWGSSPTDVWVGGGGGITPYDRLWHFDGNVWRPYNHHVSVFPTCIFGFAQNDVWMGGNDGKIFHFNGSTWSQNYRYWNDTLYTTEVRSLCGISPDNIYAVGTIYYNINDQPKSFILHYDGNNWTPLFISSEYVQFLEIDIDGNNIYIYGYMNPTDSTLETVAFYKMNGNKAVKIFQKTTREITWASPCQIGAHTYFLIGKDLTFYINGKFSTLVTFDVDEFNYYVSGRSLKDLFLHMRNGLAHYNGENIEYLYQFDNSFISIYHKPLLFEKDVYFTVHDNMNDINLILEGKLEE